MSDVRLGAGAKSDGHGGDYTWLDVVKQYLEQHTTVGPVERVKSVQQNSGWSAGYSEYTPGDSYDDIYIWYVTTNGKERAHRIEGTRMGEFVRKLDELGIERKIRDENGFYG